MLKRGYGGGPLNGNEPAGNDELCWHNESKWPGVGEWYGAGWSGKMDVEFMVESMWGWGLRHRLGIAPAGETEVSMGSGVTRCRGWTGMSGELDDRI
ncbi:hypothetical protein Tco_0693251 [Tanacetum coccineum]